MDLFLFNIPFTGKERAAKTTLMPAKLCAVLATCGFSEKVQLRAVLVGVESGVIYFAKTNFSEKPFNLFISGPDRLN